MVGVYVMTDSDGYITDINSDIFIPNIANWTKIDEGNGGKYAHAQGNYLPKPVRDEHGRYNYRLTNGKVVEIPDEDKPPVPVPEPSAPTNAELAAAIAELAGVMFGD